ncbi:hypothetical protein ABZ557_17670 [Streptomyces sp. NPDC019645]
MRSPAIRGIRGAHEKGGVEGQLGEGVAEEIVAEEGMGAWTASWRPFA